MKDMNGIQVFDDGETPEIPEGLSTNFEVLSPFGFKIVEHEGKKMWKVGTEEDYREAEAKRLGKSPEEITIDATASCHSSGPKSCGGNCYNWPKPGTRCTLCYNPTGQYYYCACK
ncbi:hypothetical protein ACFLQP_01380 [Acidobacteriota bacterium]